MKKRIILILFVLSLLLLVGCQQRGKATDMLARQQYVQQDYAQRAYAPQNYVGLQAQRPSVIRERPQDLTQPVYSTDSQIRTDALVERDYLAVKPTYQREITRTTADVLLITETPPTTKPSETDYDEKGKIIGEWWENKTKDGKCKKIIYHGYEPNKENCTVEVILVDNNCDGEWDEMLVIKYGNNKKDWDEKREGTKTRKIYRKVKFEGGYKFKKVLKETKEWLDNNTLKKTKETKETRVRVEEWLGKRKETEETINKKTETIYNDTLSGEKKVKETVTEYKDDGKTVEKVSETSYKYGSDGKLKSSTTVEKDKDGNKVKETVTEYEGDGKTVKKKIVTEYTGSEGNEKKTKVIVTEYCPDGYTIKKITTFIFTKQDSGRSYVYPQSVEKVVEVHDCKNKGKLVDKKEYKRTSIGWVIK